MRVDIGRLLHETLARLDSLEVGEGIVLQPFKKDRLIVVIQQEGGYQVVERGFVDRDFVVEAKTLRKLLKTLYRKEFPRSHKVWLSVQKAEEIHALVSRH